MRIKMLPINQTATKNDTPCLVVFRAQLCAGRFSYLPATRWLLRRKLYNKSEVMVLIEAAFYQSGLDHAVQRSRNIILWMEKHLKLHSLRRKMKQPNFDPKEHLVDR